MISTEILLSSHLHAIRRPKGRKAELIEEWVLNHALRRRQPLAIFAQTLLRDAARKQIIAPIAVARQINILHTIPVAPFQFSEEAVLREVVNLPIGINVQAEMFPAQPNPIKLVRR
jgi:hypothetical protein